jgi:hypothetical protein
MQSKELKIGNIVNVYLRNQTQEIEIEKIEKNYINNFSITSIKPIPITEEWLLKLGFEIERKQNGDLQADFNKSRFNVYYKNSYNGFLFCDNDTVLTTINHIHQLQNLYFVLTGEELKIK